MSRRRTSFLDDLMDIAEVLPWWIGVILTITSYLIFHWVSQAEVGQAKDIQEIPWKQGLKLIGTYMQYIFPIALGAGTILSGYKQWNRGKIYNKQTSIDSIRQLSWRDFEQLISEAYRKQGYQVVETEDGPDGGVDLILRKDGKKILVQCKHWKKQKVGVKEVRELNGVVAAKGAYSGILVTSGTFTTEALNFSGESQIELIDGEKLTKLIPQIESSVDVESSHNLVPSCPRCGNSMVKKIARQGFNAGNEFWGCSTYPKCKGTMNIIN